MKIAIVVGHFPLISQAVVLNQIVGLMKLGYEVDIFSFSHGDTNKIHSDIKKYGFLEKVVYLDPLSGVSDRIRETRIAMDEKYLKKFGFKLPFLNLFRYVRNEFMIITLILSSRLKGVGPYDIIHCQIGTVGLRFLPLRRFRIFGGKLIVQFRGEDITEYVKQKGNKIYDKLFQEGDCFMPVCDYFRKLLIELGCPKDKIYVLRSGIDCKRFKFKERKKPTKGPIKIAFVGRLVEKKGVEYAIRAVAILKKRGYQIELVIVGNGPLMKELKSLSRELNIQKHIAFLGVKNHDEIIEILNGAHLFAAPSVTSRTGNQEGIPNTLKEAMAMGLPVVSTYHAGIPELVEDGVSGLLVPERDHHALAEKLGYLIDHPKRWRDMGSAGRKFVEKNYDSDKLDKELVDIYRKQLKSVV